MITMIHALWEFSPIIAGFLCGSVTLIRNPRAQGALITKASLAIGTVFACIAGELAGTPLIAVLSIVVDSGAAGLGLIVAHVVVRRSAA
jgi:hypothetical protein